jgi:peptidoglycan/xylan/chitin deacetylase (PgdA/CDA1 family)
MTTSMAGEAVSILMYHSIAIGRDPITIAPATFRMQLDMLAGAGYRGVSVREYLASRTSHDAGSRIAVLTFDDGYQDFADVVVPEMESRGWSCTVFLCSDLVGASGGWDPDGGGAEMLIDWQQAEDLAKRGVEIGGHGLTHADLTQIDPARAQHEIAASKDALEARAHCTVTSFAAPYGHTTPAIRATIARFYGCAVGTTMAKANALSDRYDLPRVDMWYFRDPSRWRAYLNGSMTYFRVRKVLRQARIAMGMGAGTRQKP